MGARESGSVFNGPHKPPAGVHQFSFTLSAPSLHQTTAVIKQSVINSSTSVESLEKEAISAIFLMIPMCLH